MMTTIQQDLEMVLEFNATAWLASDALSQTQPGTLERRRARALSAGASAALWSVMRVVSPAIRAVFVGESVARDESEGNVERATVIGPSEIGLPVGPGRDLTVERFVEQVELYVRILS
jgi:hypothetical protein